MSKKNIYKKSQNLKSKSLKPKLKKIVSLEMLKSVYKMIVKVYTKIKMAEGRIFIQIFTILILQ